MKTLLSGVAVAATLFIYFNSGSEAKVVAEPRVPEAIVAFMGTPMYADELDSAGIDSIVKKKINPRWLQRQFRSNDQTVISDIYEYIKSVNAPCPCPYLRYTNDSRRCGKNTSYMRGTLGKLCYPKDVIEFRVAAKSKGRSH
jgi:hypothetical protein